MPSPGPPSEQQRPSGTMSSEGVDSLAGETADPQPDHPKLAEGVELIGLYDGSGYEDPPYIARRADGQVVQFPPLLYLVLERCDGRRDLQTIAEEVSEAFGRGLEREDVGYLVDEKLRPLGMLEGPDGSQPRVRKADAFLALRFRMGVVPEGLVRLISALFKPLFHAPIVGVVVVAFAAFDYWLFFVHGVGEGLREVMYQPSLLLVVFALLIATTAFHEIGHASASKFGGAEPGVIGVGVYIVWPAFYTDVTDAYRLDKKGRLRVDLGGIYFNAIFILALGALYAYTGWEVLLIAAVVHHLEILHQFLPFVRLDGYYMISDLTGVPDLFARIKPILASLIPGREPGPQVQELKPWVRRVVTAWVLTAIPFLLFNLGLIVFHAPRIFGTAWDSLAQHGSQFIDAIGEGAIVTAAAGALQSLFLVLPLLGIVYMLTRLGRNAGTAAWQHSEGQPLLRTGYITMGVVVLGFVGFVWWPNSDYQPIQRGERWTVQEAVTSFRDAPQGRGGLGPLEVATEQRRVESTPSPSPEASPSPSPSPTLEDLPGFGPEDASPSPSPLTDAEPDAPSEPRTPEPASQ